VENASHRYERFQDQVADVKQRVMEYENRLRYANDIIQNLESENQQIELDVAQARGAIESQNRAYNELKNNYYLLSSDGGSGLTGSMSSPLITIPKVVMPTAYYKPNPMPTRQSINLMPVVSKAIS
jgi:predicted nuclease with TOPRIM domain